MTIPVSKLKKQWLKNPDFRKGYDALEAEFALASILIEARVKAQVSQQELAKRMGTSQSTIARLESGAALPSLKTLYRLADALGLTVDVSLRSPRSKASKAA